MCRGLDVMSYSPEELPWARGFQWPAVCSRSSERWSAYSGVHSRGPGISTFPLSGVCLFSLVPLKAFSAYLILCHVSKTQCPDVGLFLFTLCTENVSSHLQLLDCVICRKFSVMSSSDTVSSSFSLLVFWDSS